MRPALWMIAPVLVVVVLACQHPVTPAQPQLDAETIFHTRAIDWGGQFIKLPAGPSIHPLLAPWVLDLHGSLVTDERISLLPADSGVNEIDLSSTAVDGSGLRLFPARFLTKLRLAKTRVTNTALESIGTFPNLHELDLSDTAVDAKGLALLRRSNLSTLALTRTPIANDAIPICLKNERLKRLNIAETAISDEAFETSTPNSMLEDLDLSRTKVTDKAMPAVAEFAKLSFLKLLLSAE